MNHPGGGGAEITLGRFQTVYGSALGGQRQIQHARRHRLAWTRSALHPRPERVVVPRAQVLKKWFLDRLSGSDAEPIWCSPEANRPGAWISSSVIMRRLCLFSGVSGRQPLLLFRLLLKSPIDVLQPSQVHGGHVQFRSARLIDGIVVRFLAGSSSRSCSLSAIETARAQNNIPLVTGVDIDDISNVYTLGNEISK